MEINDQRKVKMFKCLCGHKQLLGNKCVACGRENQMQRMEEDEDDNDGGLSIAVAASLFSINPPDSSETPDSPSDTFDSGGGESGGGGSSEDY